MEERFAYGLNPEKLGAVSSYLCDPAMAYAEFLLVKSQYQAEVLKNMVGQFRLKSEHAEIKSSKAKKPGVKTVKAEVQQKPQIRLNDAEFGKY